MQYVREGIHDLTNFFIGRPLRHLYLSGPSALGFWQGQDAPSICSQLTGATADFWLRNPAECGRLIDSKWEAFRAVALTATWAYCLYKVASVCWWRYAVVQPLLRELRSHRRGLQLKDA